MSLAISGFLIFNILYTNSQKFNDICFSMVDEPETNILIKFDDRLPFIPDLIEMRAITKGYTSLSFVGVLKITSYFLKKEKIPCSNSFIYEVPNSYLPILTINVTISFGDSRIVLDELQAAIKPDFKDSEHIFDGLLGHTQTKVILRHESSNQSASIQRSQSKPPYRWSSKPRKLRSGESYCLSLFTTEFSEPLVLLKYPTDGDQPRKYYIFTVTTSGHMIPYRLQMKKYLSKVYPCPSSIPSEKRLKIYVCPFTTDISFELTERSLRSPYKIKYFKKLDRFVIATRSPSFYFDKLEIINMHLKKDMVNNKRGMLLYHDKLKREYCSTDIPSFLKDLKLSYIEVSKAGGVVLEKHSRVIDESTSDSKIYKIRTATSSEFEKCQK